MLCFDVILFGRIAPAPPAYMLPPQMPSMLNEIQLRSCISCTGSSAMNLATPRFFAATTMSISFAASRHDAHCSLLGSTASS